MMITRNIMTTTIMIEKILNNFKKWPTFLFRDLVIWPLTNNISWPMWRTRLHMWIRFSDNWLKPVTCIAENVTISFKHEYRRPTLTSRCDVTSYANSIKTTFSAIISDHISTSDVKMNLSETFRNIFQMKCNGTIACQIPYIWSFWSTF